MEQVDVRRALQRGREDGPSRVLATLLFTDLVASTARVLELGDRRWVHLLEAHHRSAAELVRSLGGCVVDAVGDGVFAVFDLPSAAVRAACAVRDSVRALGLELRAGLHTAECEVASGCVRGFAVHVAARVSAVACGGEVLVSQTVRDVVAGSDLRFVDRGPYELKGLPGAWRLYAAQPPRAERPAERPVGVRTRGRKAVGVVHASSNGHRVA
jgi:class 3 adenylate cyclase